MDNILGGVILLVIGTIIGVVGVLLFGGQFQKWHEALDTVSTINAMNDRINKLIEESDRCEKRVATLIEENQRLRDTIKLQEAKEASHAIKYEQIVGDIERLEVKLNRIGNVGNV